MAVVRIEYNINGIAVEEEVRVSTTSKEYTYTPPVGITTPFRTYECSATVVIFRAPRGHLKSSQKMLLAVMKSATIDPQWQQKQNMLAASQAQQNNIGIVNRGKAATDNINAIGDRSRKLAADMEKIRHKGAQDTADFVGDQQKVRDPNTGRA